MVPLVTALCRQPPTLFLQPLPRGRNGPGWDMLLLGGKKPGCHPHHYRNSELLREDVGLQKRGMKKAGSTGIKQRQLRERCIEPAVHLHLRAARPQVISHQNHHTGAYAMGGGYDQWISKQVHAHLLDHNH